MDFNLYPLFPSVIFKKESAIEFTNDELEHLYSTDIFLQPLGNGLSFSTYLLNAPEFSRIKQICLDYANFYFKDIMKYNYNLCITNSWLNVTQHSQEHAMHNHTNSIVSGVVYLKASDSSPAISFNRITPQFLLNLKAEEYNFFNSMEWEIPVEDNTILIFPSQCFHYVKKNLTSTERISIAFNTFIKGKIGADTPGGDLDLG